MTQQLGELNEFQRTRVPRFNAQLQHGGSQLSATPASGDLTSSSVASTSTGQACSIQTYIQAKHRENIFVID